MNRKQIIRKMAEKSGLMMTQNEKVLDSFMEVVAEELARGGVVSWAGFGSFRVVERASRIAYNPQTDKKTRTPVRKAPVFRVGTRLRAHVNGK